MKAYLTVMATDYYLLGVLALHKSLLLTQPQYDFAVLVTDNVSVNCMNCLINKGIKVIRAERHLELDKKYQSNNSRAGFSNWNHTLSKLLIFDLTEFEKIVYLDSDMQVMRNIDLLFNNPHMSAVVAGALYPGNESWKMLNSGLMVIEPQPGMADLLIAHLPAVSQYLRLIGDQDLIAAQHPDWPNCSELHLDHGFNVFLGAIQYYVNVHGYNVNFSSPDEKTISIVHYWGQHKPWMLSSQQRIKQVSDLTKKGDILDAQVLVNYYKLIDSINEI